MKRCSCFNPVVFFLVMLMVVMTTPAFAQKQAPVPVDNAYEQAKQDAIGICPPIFLRDENGNIINPVSGVNPDVPYSPKQTCGKCHN